MRTDKAEVGLGTSRIADIQLDADSRGDIPAILLGPRPIDGCDETRERLLENEVEPTVRSDTGRPGTTQRQVQVLCALRLGRDYDWDRSQSLANEMAT